MSVITESEQQLRSQLVTFAHSLFMRGLSSGGSGNISARLPDGNILVTPTNSCLGMLDAERLSKIDIQGNYLAGDKPSKEVPMHLALYRARPTCNAVVHLHTAHLVALSCMQDLDVHNCLPEITPYYVMRIGQLPLIPYLKPGDPAIADHVFHLAAQHNAMLLANHGPVVSGTSLREAIFNAEELEDSARIYFLLKPFNYRLLSQESIEELKLVYQHKIG